MEKKIRKIALVFYNLCNPYLGPFSLPGNIDDGNKSILIPCFPLKSKTLKFVYFEFFSIHILMQFTYKNTFNYTCIL